MEIRPAIGDWRIWSCAAVTMTVDDQKNNRGDFITHVTQFSVEHSVLLKNLSSTVRKCLVLMQSICMNSATIFPRVRKFSDDAVNLYEFCNNLSNLRKQKKKFKKQFLDLVYLREQFKL